MANVEAHLDASASRAVATTRAANYSHMNMFKELEVGVADEPEPSTLHRQARVDALPPARTADDIRAILSDDADPVYPIYRDMTLTTLVLDGLTGPLQERLFAGAAGGGARPSTHMVMLFSNLWALVYLCLLLFADDTAAALCGAPCRARLAVTVANAARALPGGLGLGDGAVTPAMLGPLLGVPAGADVAAVAAITNATGVPPLQSHFGAALAHCKGYPDVVPKLLLFAVASAVGQNFIFYTLGNTSALTCTTITTTRKFFTILASVVLFPGRNHVNPHQWAAVATVFGGLGLNALAKRRKATQQAKAK